MYERSMGLRALHSTIIPPPGVGAVLATMPAMAHYGAVLRLMPPIDTDTEHDDIAPADRDTQPPSPQSEPPPGYDPRPSEALKKMLGYDENLFLHAALLAAADSAHEQRQANKAINNITSLFDKQTERILKETSADYGALRSSITGLQQSVDALVTRIGNTETALDAGTKRFAAIEDELAAMRSQMSRLEDLRPHLERLEAKLAKMKQPAP